MAEILIIGASGGIGLECTRQALAAGHVVRAFSRAAQDIAIDNPRLTKINGDATNPGDCAGAVHGADAVAVTLGVAFDSRMLLGPVTLFSRATKALLPAMDAAGVKRLIAVTGFGAGESRQAISLFQRLPFRLVFGRAYDDKSRQERLIKKSGLDWTIVRPGVLTNGDRSDGYKVLVDRQSWRNGLIARADVAHFIISQISDDAYVGQAPVLIRSGLPLS